MTTIIKGDFLTKHKTTELDAFDSFPAKRKFNEWYSGQVKAQLDDGISIDDVQVGLELTKFKPIHAGWLVEFYNHMSASKG